MSQIFFLSGSESLAHLFATFFCSVNQISRFAVQLRTGKTKEKSTSKVSEQDSCTKRPFGSFLKRTNFIDAQTMFVCASERVCFVATTPSPALPTGSHFFPRQSNTIVFIIVRRLVKELLFSGLTGERMFHGFRGGGNSPTNDVAPTV